MIENQLWIPSFLEKYACSMDKSAVDRIDEQSFAPRKEDNRKVEVAIHVKNGDVSWDGNSPGTTDTSIMYISSSEDSDSSKGSYSLTDSLGLEAILTKSTPSFESDDPEELTKIGIKTTESKDDEEEDDTSDKIVAMKSMEESKELNDDVHGLLFNNENDSSTNGDDSISDDNVVDDSAHGDTVEDDTVEDDTVENANIEDEDYPPSVRAGLRLYQQAIARQKRLQALANPSHHMRKNRNTDNIIDGDSISSDSPRYQMLYELGVKRQNEKAHKRFVEINNLAQKNVQSVTAPPRIKAPLGENERCVRLYNLSHQQQLEGKKRRRDIEVALEKANELCEHLDKISVKDGERLYYEGVRYLLELDRRRIEAAIHLQTEHKPFCFREELKARVQQQEAGGNSKQMQL